MKIVLINNLYFPFNRGGAEKIVADSIKKLQSEGHTVFLITTKPKRSADPVNPVNPKLKIYYFNSLFYNLGRYPSWFRLGWHFHNLFDKQKYQELKKMLKQINPDRVITHNLMGLGFKTPQAIRELKIEHWHVLHDVQLLHPSGLMLLGKEKIFNKWPARLYQSLTRRLFASPAKILSPSRWLLKEHLKRGFFPDSNYQTGPLVPKVSSSQRQRTTILPGHLAHHFLFVGQLEKHKGILWLIAVLKKMSDIDFTLTIAGDGSQKKPAKILAGNDSRFIFLGRQKSEEISRLMSQADYLIVPSFCYENHPTVIDEAHRQGCLVLAADLGGTAEMIDSGDRLFKAGDVTSLKAFLKS